MNDGYSNNPSTEHQIMCQAYEGERKFLVWQEKEEIYQRWESHQRGEIELSDDDIKEMAVRMIMLREQ